MHNVSPTSDDLARRCAAVALLVVDVDGVLTDGGITIDDNGVESKTFSVRDGSGFHLWRKAGFRAAILSGRFARVVDIRAAELGISPVIQGRSDKLAPFVGLVADLGLAPEQVAYMGDDLTDLPVLTLEGLGLAACPADAVPEVLAAAHLVTSAAGGRGAARELVERILKVQGRWETLVASAYPTVLPRHPV